MWGGEGGGAYSIMRPGGGQQKISKKVSADKDSFEMCGFAATINKRSLTPMAPDPEKEQ